jgi:hypothetical protein
LTVGPELYTPNGGGNVKTCDYYGHCGWLYGFGWWEDALLRYFDTNFPTFTIHNYSDTNTGSYNATAVRLEVEENQLVSVFGEIGILFDRLKGA